MPENFLHFPLIGHSASVFAFYLVDIILLRLSFFFHQSLSFLIEPKKLIKRFSKCFANCYAQIERRVIVSRFYHAYGLSRNAYCIGKLLLVHVFFETGYFYSFVFQGDTPFGRCANVRYSYPTIVLYNISFFLSSIFYIISCIFLYGYPFDTPQFCPQTLA